MKSLQEKIKFLQRKQAEVDLFRLVIKNLEAETEDSKEHPGLTKDVTSEIIKFCNSRIANIEASITVGEDGAKPVKAAIPPPKPVEKPAETLKEVPPPPPEEDAVYPLGFRDVTLDDPLKFITFFRGWLKKTVKLKQPDGKYIQVEIAGIAFPDLKVVTSDRTFTVDPRKLERAG